jgi:alpha-N-acetylglucosamine transferase
LNLSSPSAYDITLMLAPKHSRLILIAVAVAAVCTLLFFSFTSIPQLKDSLPRLPSSLSLGSANKTQCDGYAYATFLSTRTHDDDEEDIYFTATRALAYQLLHQPSTRSTLGCPFVVIVVPHVSQRKRRVLAQEGATVVEVAPITPKNWTLHPGEDRWIDQFAKLRLFGLTQFERILYMDNDMLVTRPLDDIWQETEIATPQKRKSAWDDAVDEMTLPENYVLAGVTDAEGPAKDFTHPAPITPSSRLNGGFWVMRPDKHLFDYYMELLENENVFNSVMMEMGLLNYAHRRKGPMPWAPLRPGKWNSNWPGLQDLESGTATLHDKFWESKNKDWIDRELVEMWWRTQGRMEGYWQKKRNG